VGAAKKVGIVIGILFVIIVIVGGLFVYSYTQIHVSLNDVKFHSIDWTSFSWSTLLSLGLNALSGNWLGAAFDLIDGVNLNLIFGLANNGIFPVYIPDLSYDLSINGVSVGNGYSSVNLTINPGESKQLTVLQNFQKSRMSPAVSSIVATGGIIDLRVSGTAHFKLFGIDIPVPFQSSKQISIKDEIEKRLNSEIQKNKQQQKSTVSSAIGSVVKEIFGDPDDLDLQLAGKTIVDSVYKVGPGSHRYVYFTVNCVATVQGGFLAHAALGDNIIVFFLDEDEFKKYESGQTASVYYNSGKVESGVFDLTVNPGKYYIVMSNTYSDFSTKTVQLQVAGFCK